MPIEIAPTSTTPVLGLYGGSDASIPSKDVEPMEATLAKGKSDSKIEVYADADHGFRADCRPFYNAKAAEDGWKQLFVWFRTHAV